MFQGLQKHSWLEMQIKYSEIFLWNVKYIHFNYVHNSVFTCSKSSSDNIIIANYLQKANFKVPGLSYQKNLILHSYTTVALFFNAAFWQWCTTRLERAISWILWQMSKKFTIPILHSENDTKILPSCPITKDKQSHMALLAYSIQAIQLKFSPIYAHARQLT